MAPDPRRRVLAGVLAGSLLLTTLGALVPTTASAATTTLFSQPFHNATANGDGAVVLPAPSNAATTNVACLTASGNTTVVPRSCPTNTDAAGAGKLRLTPNTTSQAGGLFAATSLPTSKGLDVTFNTYQYGGGANPADGIAFALAAVDPANPLSPPNMGPVGGALGYAYANGTRGLAYGYLGVGFDVYGNFSNASYQGTTAAPGSTAGCTNPAYISSTGQVKGQVVVRGPGNGSVGYCALASTAANTTSPAVALRASTREASRVPVEVVINPATTAITTASGITVAARSYAVQFTPVGGTVRTLTGTLPTVSSSLYPASYLDASGYPKQLALGFVGSTGSLTDFHEIDEAKAVSLDAVPELSVAQTAYTQPTLAQGDPVSYVVRTGVLPGATESAAVSVTDTLPAGVTPTGGYGNGWVCAPPVGQKITCTNGSTPFVAGSSLPPLTITGTVTGTGVTPAVIQSNSIVTASSNDANPAYSSSAAAGTPTAAPTNLAIAPASGPTGAAVTITGTGTAAATAIQIGTSAELAAATGTTLTPCPGNTAAAGCFTVNATTGALSISAMPSHATGPVQVKVVTLGSAGTVGFTYTSVPGTPTVTAAAGPATASVSWEAPASGGSAISGYTVTPYRDGIVQPAVALAAGATSYTVSGATVGASYTFTVAARNSNGTGLTSPRSNAVVPYAVPAAPTIGTASAGTSAARLSWTAPASDGSSPITGYVVTPYLNGTAQPVRTFASTDTTQTLTGLTAGGSYTFTVAAVNAAGTGPASARSSAVTVNSGPAIVSTPGDGEVGAAYSTQLAVGGGTGGYTFALTDGSLPAGLTLSGSGLITGTPTAAGSSTFTVAVTDTYGVSSSRTFTVAVAPAVALTFAPALPATTVGAAYSQPLDRTGGTGPFTFSVSGGSLPAGLGLDARTGVLSGTPTRSGDYTFTVKVVDSFGSSDTRAATLAVRTVPGAPTLGTVTAGTSAATVTWTAPTTDGGSPVTGYVVTPYLDGVAQTPLTAGASANRLVVRGLTAGSSYTFTVAAVNAIGTGPATARSAAVVPNEGPSLTSTPGNGEVGAAYNHQLTSSGGTGTVTYALATGTLPAGLTLSGAGLISGTPTTAGSSTFQVRVVDEEAQASTRTFTVVVAAAVDLTFAPALPAANLGTPYRQPLSYTGGTGPFTFSVSAGSLPAGLSLDAGTGVLSGTPTRGGEFAFTVEVVDSFGQRDTGPATLVVRDEPGAPAAPVVTAGTSAAKVSWSAPTNDGGSPVTGYVVTPYRDGEPQRPVTFTSTTTTQIISGLTEGASYTFTVAAVNAIGTGAASPRSAAITVNEGPAISSSADRGEVGAAYSQQLAVSGGTGPFTFDVTDGDLPAGLTLSSGGLVSGTPTADGSSTFTVRVTDVYGASSTTTLTLVVAAAPSLTYSSPLPRGTVGTTYGETLTRTGGTGPFTFAVTGGTVPAGLALDAATGVLSGTPTASGTFAFTVEVTDAFGQRDTKITTLAVDTVPGAPAIGPVSGGTTTATVSWSAPTDDGNSAVTGYVVTPYLDGAPVANYTFDATATTRTLTGLTAGGPYTFTVAAVNDLGTGAPSALSEAVTVNAALALTGALDGGEVGVAYRQQLAVAGGTGALTFGLGSGSLPDGLDLSSTGLLSGTPTDAGSSTFSVRVTDANGAAAARTFTVVVVPAPALTFDPDLPEANVGAVYDRTLTRTGGTGPFTFSVSGGTLPPGLGLDPATGVLSGTATAAGDYAFTVNVVDALGQSDTRAATLAVRAVPAAPAIGTVAAATGAAVVRWTAPADDGNSPVTGYLVTPYLDGVAQTPQDAAAGATRLTVTGLTAGRSYTFTVAAVNAAGTSPESAPSAAVVPNAGPGITSTPPRGEVGLDYRHQLTSSGGTGTVTFAVTTGALPDGLSLSSSGLISGTPTRAGSATVRVQVTDAGGATSARTFTVVVEAQVELTFDPALPDGERGEAYSTTLSRTGGVGPFTFAVTEGTLPAGLELDTSTGRLSGTPTEGGSSSFAVEVTDALGQSDTRRATLLVRAPAEVALTVSRAQVPFGSAVTLTARLTPSSATGTVTFRATAPDGSRVELGSAEVSGGAAARTTTLPAFGRYLVTAAYEGDGTNLADSSPTRTVDINGYAGQAVITEFRTSGPAGADDSYVELYNAGPAMPLAGLVLESSSGTRTVLPADAPVLGQFRSYLVVGEEFSLTADATPDLTTETLGTGGFRLVIPDSRSTVTDEAGPSSGFHLGAGLPALSGTPAEQWAFVRTETAGRPDNSRDNLGDFALVSSDGGRVGGVQSMRGSASPTGLADDWQHNGQALSYLLDPTKAVDAVPNRPYVVGSPGTLEVRRTITNTGTTTITSAKARVTALSEANGLPYRGTAPARVALIRAVNPKSPTSAVPVPGRGTVTVRNLTVDSPITARAGGGLNSTFTIPLPSGGLAPGASVDVAFTFDVDTRGTFWFGYDVDARTATTAALRAQTKVVSKAEVQRRLEKAGKSRSRAVAGVTTGTL